MIYFEDEDEFRFFINNPTKKSENNQDIYTYRYTPEIDYPTSFNLKKWLITANYIVEYNK